LTEAETLKELAAAAARIVVLEKEAVALRQEAKRLRERAAEEFGYSERLLRNVHAQGGHLAIGVQLEEVLAAIREETAAVDAILEVVMCDRQMREE
jgi:hypothetical protein